MTKPEIRINDEARMTNRGAAFVIWASDFIRHSGFVIPAALRGIDHAAGESFLQLGDARGGDLGTG